MAKYKQGRYIPTNPEKWVNPENIIYRSSWEFFFQNGQIIIPMY